MRNKRSFSFALHFLQTFFPAFAFDICLSDPKSSSLATHVCIEERPNFRTQPLLSERLDPAPQPLIRLSHILANPALHIRNVSPRIGQRALNRRQLRETDAKAHVVDVLFDNHLFGRGWHRGVFEQFQQRFRRECPSLFVFFGERGRVGEGFGEGEDGDFAIEGADEFLGGWEDDVEV